MLCSEHRRNPSRTLVLAPLPQSTRVACDVSVSDLSDSHRHLEYLGAIEGLFNGTVCDEVAQAQRGDC
jgi:hypothetical protein